MMPTAPLTAGFFDQEPQALARGLLGKVLRHRVDDLWLSARIIEAEAYDRTDRASHSSLGRTPSREAMFDPPGTIYMYYARGADSLNFSARGAGNAVLIKAAFPVADTLSDQRCLERMQALNPGNHGPRTLERLCRGQTLLCRALGLRVTDWNRRPLDPERFRIDDDGYRPARVVRCPRLGIPVGRDEHLLYRFVDESYARHCTSNPLTKRGWVEGRDFVLE